MSGSTPTNEYVADTVALIFRLEGRQLGRAAIAAFDAAEAGTARIYVPAMVLAEILYLAEKKRIAINLTHVSSYLAQNSACLEYPLTAAVVQAAAQIQDVRELHDRLIAGTALLLRCPLLTCDASLQASLCISTLW
jgi:predicted nucleic acid-binding protein